MEKIADIDFYGLAAARHDLQEAALEAVEETRRAVNRGDMEAAGRLFPLVKEVSAHLMDFDAHVVEILRGCDDPGAAVLRLEAAYSEFPPGPGLGLGGAPEEEIEK